MRAKFYIPNSSQSPDIGQNSDGGISIFLIFGQSLTNPKQNDVKNIWWWRLSANCNFIVIFQIYGQFGAIRKLDSGRIVCKTFKKWKQLKNL